MYIRLGDTHGNIWESNYHSDQEILDQIAELDGRMGNKHFSDVLVETVDDVIAFMERVFALAMADEDGDINLEVGDKTVHFKTNEVGWFRIVR